MKHKYYRKDKEYLQCVEDILNHKVFKKMDDFIQHGTTSTMEHCISVSYYSYLYCKKHNLDYRTAARAGLLHDLFLYDWHTCRKEKGIHLHGFTHPKTSLNNALCHFSLTKKEKDIIIKHMWPITVIPPKSKEGFVVMYFDKHCGFLEMIEKYKTVSTVKES